MHGPGRADDTPPVSLSNGLMPEAYAKGGARGAERPDGLHRDARLRRRARSRREHQRRRRKGGDVVDRDGIVAPNVDVRAKLAEVLDEIVRERIVVIDDEDHCNGSPSWMITPVHAAQILPIHVRVYLRRGDVRVPQHLLHRPQICAALEQVRCEGMPQRMRRNVLGDSRSLDVAVQDLPPAHARQGPPARVEKENTLPLTLLDPRPGPALAPPPPAA